MNILANKRKSPSSKTFIRSVQKLEDGGWLEKYSSPRRAWNPNLAKGDVKFQEWYKKNTLEGQNNIPYTEQLDYDYYSFFKNRAMGDIENHFPDTYKRPTHATFSNESIYSTPENPGGYWKENTYMKEGKWLDKYQDGGRVAQRSSTYVQPAPLIPIDELYEMQLRREGTPSYRDFKYKEAVRKQQEQDALSRLGKGQTPISNFLTDVGTGTLTWGTQMRPPTEEELERNRYDYTRGGYGKTWLSRIPSLAEAATWGVVDMMTAEGMGRLSGVGKRFNTGFTQAKKPTIKEIDYSNFFDELSKKVEANIDLTNMADDYVSAVSSPENIQRLKEFDKYYGTRLSKRIEPWVTRMEDSKMIGRNKKITSATQKELQSIHLGDRKMKLKGINYSDELIDFLFHGEPVGKFDFSVGADKRSSKVLYDLPKAEMNKTAWHELSHDFNRAGQFLGESTKLIKDINNTLSKNVRKLNIPFNRYNPYEHAYISSPTEYWSFLSTNLRQELVEGGLFNTYWDKLTPEILNKAYKNKGVYHRFKPYIKNTKKFIELFNRMGLSTIPAVSAYRALKSRGADKNQTEGKLDKYKDEGILETLKLDKTLKPIYLYGGRLQKSNQLRNFTNDKWLDKYK